MKKILFSILVAVIVIFYSCSTNSSSAPATTTVAQDKQNIVNTINDFYSCLNTLDDGDLSNFLLYSLFNNTSQEYNDTWIKTLTDNFELQYGDIVVNDKFQFANRTGVYTYNASTQTWTKVSNSSVITLKFPSRENQTAIDSELSVNAYSDVSTSYNDATVWLPSAANLTLKRNNTLVFSLNLSNVTFDVNTNFTMPTNADVTIYTAPFTHTFQWRRSSSTDFQLTYSSSTPQGCGTSVVTNVKLKDADYGNITSVDEDLKSVSGTITEGNLKIVYAINVDAISAITNPTPTQINNYSDAEVFYNNAKIGDLTYQEINDKSEIFIVYSDGTTENIDVYVSDFEDQVRNIFSNYLN